MHYLILFGLVLIVGLIPFFGPPSLLFAVFFHQHYHLSAVGVIAITAIATTLGRLALAKLTRLLKLHLSGNYIKNLDYAEKLLAKKRVGLKVIVGLFVLSPLPSAQLFEAAGLLDVPLPPLGLAFFFGRLVSLSFYVFIAKLTVVSLNRAWEAGFTSPLAIAGELLMILALVLLLNLRRILGIWLARTADK